ncbi:hypothetical protein HUO13_00160 [Saccharopolyspora erythraea]|uniref:hypothetical protein n=1 Tax=Saccharopolyspora erythraea TaxID=1836 RepID=UPI001BA94EF8|nr:hypothetical protein [Saccharopolyspora erythraea]QUG99424.1 hypothetical protein HUO13_00160 [Saccharopolyspora erythraea]
MDEVKTMTRAGENVGRAVGTGIRSARIGAARAGRAGMAMSKTAAARAEYELANRGIDTDELQELIARKATGMSRKQLAKRRRKARKQFARNTEIARRELAGRIAPEPRRRRKWPWVLLVLAGLAAAGVALSRRPEELPVAEAEDGPRHGTDGHHSPVPAQGDGRADRPTSLGTEYQR